MVAFLKIKLFNPSEDEINFDSFVKFALFMFRLVWLDFEQLGENASWKQRLAYEVKNIFVKIELFAFGVATASIFGYAVINSDNFLAASSAVPNVVTVGLIGIKSVSTFMHKDDIRNIFQDMRKMFVQRGNLNSKYKVKGFLDDYHFIIKIYAVIFLAVSLPIAFPVFPFIAYGTMEVTVNYWYPFDPYRVEIFPFVLIWIDWVAYNCLLYLLATDSLLYGLIAAIAMEFDILRVEFSNLRLVPKHERVQKIQNLTDQHNNLLDITDKLQNIYSLSFLYSFVISSLIMCFIAFQLSTGATTIAIYAFYVPYLGMIGGQIFLLCFLGQKLIDSSEAIADGAYNCGWECFTEISFKKQLALIIMRAQRVKRLTAMNFADLSLLSFTSVGSLKDLFCKFLIFLLRF